MTINDSPLTSMQKGSIRSVAHGRYFTIQEARETSKSVWKKRNRRSSSLPHSLFGCPSLKFSSNTSCHKEARRGSPTKLFEGSHEALGHFQSRIRARPATGGRNALPNSYVKSKLADRPTFIHGRSSTTSSPRWDSGRSALDLSPDHQPRKQGTENSLGLCYTRPACGVGWDAWDVCAEPWSEIMQSPLREARPHQHLSIKINHGTLSGAPQSMPILVGIVNSKSKLSKFSPGRENSTMSSLARRPSSLALHHHRRHCQLGNLARKGER